MEAYRAAQSLVGQSTAPAVRTSANEYLQSWVLSSQSFADFVYLLSQFTLSPIYNESNPAQSSEVACRDVLATIMWKKVKKEYDKIQNLQQFAVAPYSALLAESHQSEPWGKPNSYTNRLAFMLVTVTIKGGENGRNLQGLEEMVVNCVNSITNNSLSCINSNDSSSINNNNNSNGGVLSSSPISPSHLSQNPVSSQKATLSSALAFKLLMFIPEEVSSASMTFAEIDHLIKTFALQVLQCINIGFNARASIAVTYALDCMQKWSLLHNDR